MIVVVYLRIPDVVCGAKPNDQRAGLHIEECGTHINLTSSSV